MAINKTLQWSLFQSILSLSLCMTLVGCSSFRHQPSLGESYKNVRLSALLPSQPKILTLKIKRLQLAKAIEDSLGDRSVRIVPIFRRNGIRGIPEYRVFDVYTGNPFSLLGVRSGDILLGVNDRAIPRAEVMNLYPQAVLKDGKSTITLNRAGDLFQIDLIVTG